MPVNILNLPDYKILRVEENDHDYHITAEIANAPTVCMACSSEHLIGHGRNEQVIRNISSHGHVGTLSSRCSSRDTQGQNCDRQVHVVRMANDALERVRKGLREQLTTKQCRGLMHDRFVLLKRERDLNDRERVLLDGWTQKLPRLGRGLRLKEDFSVIYENASSPQKALKAFEAWNRAVVPQVRDAFADLIRAWTNWQPWIINYF